MLPSTTTVSRFVEVPRREKLVKSYTSSSDTGSDDCSDEEIGQHEEIEWRNLRFSQMSVECWSVLKAIKYIRGGGPSSCSIALSTLADQNLQDPFNLSMLCANEGLDMLVNLCEVHDIDTRVAAMNVLKKMVVVDDVTNNVIDLGLPAILVSRLFDNALDSVKAAGDLLTKIGHKRRAARAVRKLGGLPVLMYYLNHSKELLICNPDSLTDEERNMIKVANSSAKALSVLARFTKTKMMLIDTGIISVIRNVLVTANEFVEEPTCSLLREVSSAPHFEMVVEDECLIGLLIDNLNDKRKDPELVVSSSLALMKAADISEIVRDLIRFHGGLAAIVNLVRTRTANRKLTAAVVGVLWKSAISMENVKVYESLGTLTMLIKLMVDDEHELRVNALGALAEMAKSPASRKAIAVKEGVVEKVVNMMGSMQWLMQANAAHLLGQLSYEPQAMAVIEERDGLRMLWSLIDHEKREVRHRALWAIMPTVTRASNPGEIIREISNSLHLLVRMLQSDDVEISTAVCAVVGEVALDYENLGVMAEQGLVRQLSKLVMTAKDDNLRRELVHAIANCCRLPANLKHFGRRNIIPKLVGYLATKNQELLAQTCRCFYTLSRDDYNCILMHSCGVVQLLLCATESSNPVTQISAAGCLSNIRRRLLSLDAQKEYQACVDSEWWPPRIGNECDPFGRSVFPQKRPKKRGFLQA